MCAQPNGLERFERLLILALLFNRCYLLQTECAHRVLYQTKPKSELWCLNLFYVSTILFFGTYIWTELQMDRYDDITIFLSF